MKLPRKQLSDREFQIVELVAKDALQVIEIAERLNLSPSTVSTHLTRARLKMDAKNIIHMVGLYWQWRSAGDREVDSWFPKPEKPTSFPSRLLQ